jgi:hypothetical protein
MKYIMTSKMLVLLHEATRIEKIQNMQGMANFSIANHPVNQFLMY